MTEIKKQVTLELDALGAPWQTVEGDCESWIILRRKIVVPKEITLPKGASGVESSWEILCREEEKRLYSGSIALNLYYQGISVEEVAKNFKEADEEESLCRELLILPEKKIEFPQQKTGLEELNHFPSLLIDKMEFEQSNPGQEQADESVRVEIPWQTWAFGKGKETSPKIVKIHLAQIGLHTFLLELLMQIELETEMATKKVPQEGFALTPKEEMVLILPEENAEQVLGVTIQRALCKSRGEADSKILIMESLQKTSVIFISKTQGRERFLTASVIQTARNRIPLASLPLVQPVRYHFYKQAFNYLQLDDNKILCKSQFLWGVDFLLPQPKRARGNNAKDTVRAASAAAELVPFIMARPKPGEKWFKKSGKTSKISAKSQYHSSIKLILSK